MAKKQPRFKTEAEEAEWWANNQKLIADRFEQAKVSGKIGRGTVASLLFSRVADYNRIVAIEPANVLILGQAGKMVIA